MCRTTRWQPSRPAGSADLVMRTAMAPEALAASLRGAVRAVDPMLPTADVRIMQDLVDKAVLSLLPRTPNAIREAFYHRRELGITTASGLSLAFRN